MKSLLLAFLVSAGDGGKIEWTRNDLDGVLQKARESKRPALVYFTADW